MAFLAALTHNTFNQFAWMPLIRHSSTANDLNCMPTKKKQKHTDKAEANIVIFAEKEYIHTDFRHGKMPWSALAASAWAHIFDFNRCWRLLTTLLLSWFPFCPIQFVYFITQVLSCVCMSCVLGISWIHSVCCCTLERQRDCLLRHSDHLFILNFCCFFRLFAWIQTICFILVLSMCINCICNLHLCLSPVFESMHRHTPTKEISYCIYMYAFECGQL